MWGVGAGWISLVLGKYGIYPKNDDDDAFKYDLFTVIGDGVAL